jgi:hypothetical protein
MAAGTEAALLTGIGDKHLVLADVAADAGEAEVQIAAAQEPPGHVADDRSPVFRRENYVYPNLSE